MWEQGTGLNKARYHVQGEEKQVNVCHLIGGKELLQEDIPGGDMASRTVNRRARSEAEQVSNENQKVVPRLSGAKTQGPNILQLAPTRKNIKDIVTRGWPSTRRSTGRRQENHNRRKRALLGAEGRGKRC